MDDVGGRTMTCGIMGGAGIEVGTHHRRQEVGIGARKLARQKTICIWGVPLGSKGILKLSSRCTQRPTLPSCLANIIIVPSLTSLDLLQCPLVQTLQWPCVTPSLSFPNSYTLTLILSPFL